MDAPRKDIYKSRVNKSSVLYLHTMFAMLCRKNGFELLDLTQSMAKDYEAKKVKFNSKIDGHWNEYGHQFVAQKILETFFD